MSKYLTVTFFTKLLSGKPILLTAILVIFFSGLHAQQLKKSPLLPKREFRGAWVATVANIDWPLGMNKTTEQQKKELKTLFDKLRATGINAVMFQIRPAADAFYGRGFEPWSKYLTGQQGRAPNPYYDPLDFAIAEAHKRGMELHAWVNPYRATKDTNYAALSPEHITNKQPQWFFEYDGMKLFNPGIPEVRKYILKVILNVIKNYDIDGIHFDDYFYPYQIKGQEINDQDTYRKYGKDFKTIEDWRRDNVNQLIAMLSLGIKRQNFRIKFGVSPSCIWANKSQDPDGSETQGGDTYFQLFADTRKWIKEGWIDYINPQIYHAQTDKAINFNILVDWWSYHTYNRHLYIGQAPYRVLSNHYKDFQNPNEIPSQINYLRNNPRVQGSVYFSAKSLIANPLGLADTLIANYYYYPALPPVMIWKDAIGPNKPKALYAGKHNGSIILRWKKPAPSKDKEPVYGYVIYRNDKSRMIDVENPKLIYRIVYSNKPYFIDNAIKAKRSYTYKVTAIDRLKNESMATSAVTFQCR